jgi:hypothetical protein
VAPKTVMSLDMLGLELYRVKFRVGLRMVTEGMFLLDGYLADLTD